MADYTPFGEEWENEMKKLPKIELINMIRKLEVGATDKKLMQIETATEAQKWMTGIINDFETGIYTKEETMGKLGEYTARLMELFFKNAEKLFIARKELLK